MESRRDIGGALHMGPSRAESARAEGPLARKMPYNLEAEQGLLGAVLVNNKAFEKIAEFLQAEHFYDPVHGRIFSAIAKLVDRNQLADIVTLKTYFENDSALAGVGGSEYLADLSAYVIGIINVEEYGRLIYDLHLRRKMIDLGEEMVNTAFAPDLDISALEHIEASEQKLYDLATKGDFRGDFTTFSAAMGKAIEMAEAAFKRNSHISGVTSGLRDLDTKLGGFHPSDLIILAGRPSMGKTALATNIAFNAAKAYVDNPAKEGAVVGFFSLEMSAEQLATRILADRAEIPSEKIRRGDLRDADFTRLVAASAELQRLPLFIDDTAALSIAAVRARARRLKRSHNLGMLIVDYLQLLSGTVGASENRVQEVSQITRGLKAIAKELDIPVIALSQLSRAVEQREDKRPQLSDLRESGSIEQDADVVMFVFREQYYLERAEPSRTNDERDDAYNERYARWQERCQKVHNTGEVILAKQRHGPIGNIRLYFDGQFTRFGDLDSQHGLDD
jgi:replicative DNA helicase